MPDKTKEPEAQGVTGTQEAQAAPTETPKSDPTSAAPDMSQKADAAAITGMVARANLPASFAVEMMNEGLSYAQASDRVIAKIAQKAGDADGGDIVNTARIVSDGVERMQAGMSEALLAKKGMEGGKRNEFSSMSLAEMARHTLQQRGLTIPQSRSQMIGFAFVPSMAGGVHSTSDFGNVLADVAHKSMLMGYTEVEENFTRFTRQGTLTDFKPTKRVGTGQFPTLDKVEEGADFTYGTMGDHAETIVAATYGKLFAISRQAVINDDLGAFTDVPRKAGQASKRTVAALVYAILNDNPAMSDGTALFHADHGNLAGSGAVPSEATIDAALTAMASQKGRGAAEDAQALNIQPRFLLAPFALRSAVMSALMSEKTPDTSGSKSSERINTVYKAAEPIFDNRITGNKWFMAADPNMVDTIEVAYLDGITEPFIDQQDGWSVDGTEFKVRIDAGAKALDQVGLYKNPGS